MTELPWWLSLANALLCLLWSCVAIVATRFLVRRFIAYWPTLRDMLGPPGTRTLALVCTGALFIGTVPAFVKVPLRLFYSAIVAVPLQAGQGAGMVEVKSGGDEPIAPPEPLHVLARTARLLFSSMGSELETFSRDLPYVQLVFFLITWFAISQGLKAFVSARAGDDASGVQQVLQVISADRGMLVLLLAVGLSLCVASITAVSELHDKSEPDNTAPSSKELEERLRASQDGFGTETYPYTVAENDAVEQLRAEIQKRQQQTNLTPEQQALLGQVSAQLSFVVGARSQLRTNWDNMTKLSQGRYERATQDALTAYLVSSSSRHGVREQRQHFMSIVDWHRQARFDLRSAIEKCKQQVVGTETSWAIWATEGRVQLTGNAAASPGGKAKLRDGLTDAEQACSTAALKPVPPRVDFGEALGALKPIAGWLLQTESVQLALIVGMLGAGLLGSAVATFLLSQEKKQQNSGQLAGVVVRGVTAAIVVFLAVQGGLSTVAVSGNSAAPPNPNPYLLLLICFVAAVFSDELWGAVSRRWKKQLSDGEQKEAAPERARALPEPKPAETVDAEPAAAPAVASAPTT